MRELPYRFIPEGERLGIYMPLSVALVDYEDVLQCGITPREACERIAKVYSGPVAINIWDTSTAVATTSDGIMVDGSIVAMAASDYGVINKEFGYAEMLEIPWSSEEAEALIAEEPHMQQWVKNYPGKRLLTHPAHLNLPVHQATITGRAGNNNSATEMMHYITMRELLMPLGGQIELMTNGRVVIGRTGGVISVSINISVGEKYSRIVPGGKLKAGDTLHGSGEYAKTLKAHIPIIAASKGRHAAAIIKALEAGMVPARDVGAAPAIIAVARHLGIRVPVEGITPRAFRELESIGLTKEKIAEKTDIMSPEEIIAHADKIIPGIEHAKEYAAEDVFVRLTV